MNPHLNDMIIQQEGYCVGFDGSIIAHNVDLLLDFLQAGISPRLLYVDGDSPEIKKYNSFCRKEERIEVKKQIDLPEIKWTLPDEVLNVDINEVLISALEEDISNDSLETQTKKITRFEEELERFKEQNLIPILKLVHHVITTFIKKNVVWGIGRGSCVSSYILYLLKVHDVDPIYYDLDIDDFLD